MRTVLENGTLIDGTGSAAVANARVVIDDGRIVEVGDARTARHAGDAPEQVVDLTGKTIVPGLFDMHVHSTFNVQRNTRAQVAELLNDPDHVLFTRAINNVQTALRAGVTSVRDCGGRGAITIWLRNLINQGAINGPRMFVSGQPVTTTAGHLNFLGQVADSIDEIRTAVRRQVHLGADLIKVCATGGAMTPGSNRGRAQYTIEELTALVEDAHRLNKTVAAHCLCTEGMRNTVEAGCDTIEHCYWYDTREQELDFEPDVARRLVEKGLFVSPVIGAGDQAGFLALEPGRSVREHWRHDDGGDDHYDWMRRELAKYRELPSNVKHFANLRHLREMGAKFVAGTDAGAGITRFQDLWLCLAFFVTTLDFSVVEAIQSATQTAAEALHVDGELGTIEVGKRADIMVVEGNPVTDGIQQMQRVALVMKEGRIVAENGALVDTAAL